MRTAALRLANFKYQTTLSITVECKANCWNMEIYVQCFLKAAYIENVQHFFHRSRNQGKMSARGKEFTQPLEGDNTLTMLVGHAVGRQCRTRLR